METERWYAAQFVMSIQSCTWGSKCHFYHNLAKYKEAKRFLEGGDEGHQRLPHGAGRRLRFYIQHCTQPNIDWRMFMSNEQEVKKHTLLKQVA